MKKYLPIIISLLVLAIIVGIIIIIALTLINFQGKKADREKPMCEDIKPSEGFRKYDCCLDCHKVDMSYMKHEFNSGFFGADENNCYCVNEDKEVKQIW